MITFVCLDHPPANSPLYMQYMLCIWTELLVQISICTDQPKITLMPEALHQILVSFLGSESSSASVLSPSTPSFHSLSTGGRKPTTLLSALLPLLLYSPPPVEIHEIGGKMGRRTQAVSPVYRLPL